MWSPPVACRSVRVRQLRLASEKPKVFWMTLDPWDSNAEGCQYRWYGQRCRPASRTSIECWRPCYGMRGLFGCFPKSRFEHKYKLKAQVLCDMLSKTDQKNEEKVFRVTSLHSRKCQVFVPRSWHQMFPYEYPNSINTLAFSQRGDIP